LIELREINRDNRGKTEESSKKTQKIKERQMRQAKK